MNPSAEIIALPEPRRNSDVSLERALLLRHTVRDFHKTAVTLAELSQILWAAQGVTHAKGLRTAPSAGALYPLKLYVVAGWVSGLDAGIYRYSPGMHQLIRLNGEDKRSELARAAYNQTWIEHSVFVLVFSAVAERTRTQYRELSQRYIDLEVGHAAQNVLLQAVVLNLGAAEVGAFDDDDIHALLRLPDNEQALYLLPIGSP